MPQLMGPDFITLLVRDLDASRHFYENVIKLPISPERQPNAVAFATQPIPFAIRKSLARFEVGPTLGIILWFRADDAAALHKHLRNLGIPIVQGLADGPFGKMFTFSDPDGYSITVHDAG